MRLILLLIPVLAFGQLDDNTITVTASRPVSVQPDQVVIGIQVGATVDTTLDDVLAILKGVRVTAAELSYVASPPGTYVTPLGYWYFTVSVPLPNLTSTLSSLAAIPRNLGVNYYLQGSQVSPALEAANPCPYPALLSDAQKQAQMPAQAADGTLGAIVAVSDEGPTGAIPSTVWLTGALGAVIPASRIPFPVASQPSSPRPSCSVTVQFKLTRI